MSLPTVTLTGTAYNPDGTRAAGKKITLLLQDVLTDPEAGQVIPEKITITLDENGEFSRSVVPSNSPDLTPVPVDYLVQELYGNSRKYFVTIPYDLDPVDLFTDLTHAGTPSPPVFDYVTTDDLVAEAAAREAADAAEVVRADGAYSPLLTPVAAVTTDTAALGAFVLADATSAAFTVTLPAATLGKQVAVKKVDASANVVTVVAPGGKTIDGDSDATIVSQNASAVFVYDGTNWQILAESPGSGLSPITDPTDLAGCIGWFDAGQIAGATNGGSLASWPDMSGNSNDATQATSGKKPKWWSSGPPAGVNPNGLPVVYFGQAGATTYLDTPSLSDPAECTIFLLAQLTGGGDGNAFIDKAAGGTGRVVCYTATATQLELYAGTSLDGTIANAPMTPSVLAFVSNGGSSLVRLNGATIASGNAGTNSLGSARIGAANSGSVGIAGSLAEVIIYSRALNATDYGQVEAYLNTKYGL